MYIQTMYYTKVQYVVYNSCHHKGNMHVHEKKRN